MWKWLRALFALKRRETSRAERFRAAQQIAHRRFGNAFRKLAE